MGAVGLTLTEAATFLAAVLRGMAALTAGLAALVAVVTLGAVAFFAGSAGFFAANSLPTAGLLAFAMGFTTCFEAGFAAALIGVFDFTGLFALCALFALFAVTLAAFWGFSAAGRLPGGLAFGLTACLVLEVPTAARAAAPGWPSTTRRAESPDGVFRVIWSARDCSGSLERRNPLETNRWRIETNIKPRCACERFLHKVCTD